jgi:TonB family protein
VKYFPAVLLRPFIAAFLLTTWLGAAPPDDRSFRVIRTVEPRFPDALVRRGIYAGEASVVMLVDGGGRLADWLLTSYSHPQFGREATEALRQWRFEPAQRGGQPIGVRSEMVFSFQVSGLVLSVTSADFTERLQDRPARPPIRRVCPPHELDAPVATVRTVQPLWPQELDPGINEVNVVLDFYIDEQGRPRMPVVIRSDNAAFDFAAIEALSHWQFVPPTRGGMPVIVRATQAFRFGLRVRRGESDGVGERESE